MVSISKVRKKNFCSHNTFAAFCISAEREKKDGGETGARVRALGVLSNVNIIPISSY